MEDINIQTVLQYTSNLTILYVEDDLNIQEESKKFFTRLFKSVTIASDGEEALSIYEQRVFDIVITDIVMPNMNGLELCQKIREINTHQPIIVVSAHNEPEHLIEFINLNISQFIRKPLIFENILSILYFEAKNIFNNKMIEEYRTNLEQINNDCKDKNAELQKVKRILNIKLTQISTENINNYADSDFSKSALDIKSINELKEFEEDVSGAVLLTELSKNSNPLNIKLLGYVFLNYAKVLSPYQDYNDLKQKIELLGNTIANKPEKFLLTIENTFKFLESLIYVLKIWRDSLEENNVKRAFMLQKSIINDINNIIEIIEN
ncbi:MAG: response regulator [Sulfurimonas sp.]|nr:response regulator [Sulfurimonas sp.]